MSWLVTVLVVLGFVLVISSVGAKTRTGGMTICVIGALMMGFAGALLFKVWDDSMKESPVQDKVNITTTEMAE